MYLFFDTETTGLPKDYRAPMSRLDNWPRVIQLAWACYDANGNFINSDCDLIKPNGWTIPKEKFWLDHGYYTEINERDGKPMEYALGKFVTQIHECEYMIAHNMEYDYNVLGAEMIRYNIKSSKKLKRICTKESGTKFCKLPGGRNGSFKWPNLQELHRALFGREFDKAHDARADVEACAKSFFELLRIGEIPAPGLFEMAH